MREEKIVTELSLASGNGHLASVTVPCQQTTPPIVTLNSLLFKHLRAAVAPSRPRCPMFGQKMKGQPRR